VSARSGCWLASLKSSAAQHSRWSSIISATMATSEKSPCEMVTIDPVDAEKEAAAQSSAHGIIRRIEHTGVATLIDLRTTIAAGRLFPRVGNNAIQPFEKSASNPLICNDRILGASGLQVFNAGRGVGMKGSKVSQMLKIRIVTISYSAGRSILVSRKEPNRLSF